jgi:hypothetical protein
MRLLRLVSLSVAVVVGVSGGVANAATPSTSRVSLSSSGTEGNATSYDATVSADGRFVAFASNAINLVPEDDNGDTDVFLRDRKTGQTVLISESNTGTQGNGNSYTPRISADGRYVSFLSYASTLGADGTNGRVFRYDRQAASLTLLPMPAGAIDADDLAISGDGTRIAFTAYVAGLATVFWWDAATNQTHRASENAAGVAADGVSFDARISGDGKLVAFTSGASNLLTPADAGSYRDVFVKNISTGAVDRISITSAGGESNLHSSTPALSYDGCRAAFFTDATNLVAGQDPSIPNNVLGRDRCTGSGTELLSLTNGNAQFRAATPIDMSDNGCRVVFLGLSSSAAQMRDRCTGSTSRLDVSTAGDLGNDLVTGVSISGGTGRYVAFASRANNLVSGDGNATYDVFIRDLATNTAPTASLTTQTTGTQVRADAGASADPDGYVLNGSINWGDGSVPQSGLSGVHTYGHPGTYGVTITVTDADGESASAISAVTIGAGGGGSSGGGGGSSGGGGGPSTPGTVQLILDRVALAKSRFATVPNGKKPDATHGSTLSLRLNLAATVTLTFERVRAGRKVKGKCKPGARKGTRCTLQTPEGKLTRPVPSGTSRIALTGLVGSKRLAVGTHRLTVRAKGVDGRITAAKVLNFTIVKAKKKKGRK